MKNILAAFIISIPMFVFAQTSLSPWALKSRDVADSFVYNRLGSNVKGQSFIVFTAGDEYFIVEIKKKSGFFEYYFEISHPQCAHQMKETIFPASDSLKRKMFDTTIYKQGYITFESDFFKPTYEIASGDITYFVLKDDKGKRFGEARLSTFVKPCPIDYDVYLYFIKRLEDYANEFVPQTKK